MESKYPCPCLKCDREACKANGSQFRECRDWLMWFRWWWKRFRVTLTAAPQKVQVNTTKFCYSHPEHIKRYTRGGRQYRHEMAEQDHVELLAALLEHKGPVILSGYPSEMYDRELKGWSRITRKAYNQNADQRTEVLWCNFEVGQINLFDKMEN